MGAHPELEEELKRLIIEALVLEDMTPEQIGSDAPLFGEGLGLDSIDALEIALALEQKYGITVDEDAEENQARFASVASLASFVTDALGRSA
jgi:acyl carrier protein